MKSCKEFLDEIGLTYLWYAIKDSFISSNDSVTSGHVATWNSDGKSLNDSGFTIGKSVPADAQFTDTTYNVFTQTEDGLTPSYQNHSEDSVLTPEGWKNDGYFPQTHVGMSDTLVAEDIDNTASYTIRPAAGDTQGIDNEIESGVAELTKIEGNGLAWNQLVQNGNFVNTSNWVAETGVTFSVSDNTASITKTSGNNGIYQALRTISNHKYYVRFDAYCAESTYVRFSNTNGLSFGRVSLQAGAWEHISRILTEWSNPTSRAFYIYEPNETAHELKIRNVNIIDLSLIFGLDKEPETVEEAEAKLAALTPAKPYYQHNAGELYGVNKLHIVSYGQNLLNPANGQARLAAYSYGDSSNKYGIKAKEGDTINTISFTPDATGVAVDVTPDANGLFTIPSAGTLNVTMSSGSLANAYVWAVWDGSKDGISNYKPYEESALEIKVSEVYGKLNGSGDMVKVFSDDVMRATGAFGSSVVRDFVDVTGKTAKVKVGKKVLNGTENYSAVGDTGRFWTALNSGSAASVSNRYATYSLAVDIYNYDKTAIVPNPTDSQLLVYDPSLQTSDAIKAAFEANNVILWYELGTPAHYTDLKLSSDGGQTFRDLPTSIIVDNWGIEEQYPSDMPATGKDFTGVAAQVTATYQKNVSESIESMPDEYASLSSLKRKADKAYGAAGNVAVLDGNGNYKDSGVSVDEIVTSEDITPVDITGASYSLVLDSALDNYTNKGIYAVTYHPTSPAGKVVKTMLVVNEAATPASSPTSFAVYQTILEENGKTYRRSRTFTDAGHTTGGSWSEWENVNAYTLPTASSSTLGGVKVGDGLSISNGVLSCNHTQIANDEDENARVKCGFDNNGGNIELYVENGSGTSKSATITYDNIDRLLGGIPVVANSSGTTLTLDPNKLYVITRSTVSSLYISLGTAISGVVNEYHCIIKITSMNVPNVTWPSTIKWVGGSAPTLGGFRDYEISILNNIGVFTWVSNQQQAQPIS